MREVISRHDWSDIVGIRSRMNTTHIFLSLIDNLGFTKLRSRVKGLFCNYFYQIIKDAGIVETVNYVSAIIIT